MINDLVVNSEERNTLWQSLRERATNSECYGQKSEIELTLLDQELLSFLDSIANLDSQEDEFFEI
jgi:hypothetical protein